MALLGKQGDGEQVVVTTETWSETRLVIGMFSKQPSLDTAA
jgi:hypothetical protein